MRRHFLYIIAVFSVVFVAAAGLDAASVVQKEGRTYIKDQTGELWEVNQAQSIGFKPERFQYGIGKHAFRPLDDSLLKDDITSAFQNPRVIGIADASEARAYSISKLKYHEIANTWIGEQPVAAGY
jgi:hypothetical protein